MSNAVETREARESLEVDHKSRQRWLRHFCQTSAILQVAPYVSKHFMVGWIITCLLKSPAVPLGFHSKQKPKALNYEAGQLQQLFGRLGLLLLTRSHVPASSLRPSPPHHPGPCCSCASSKLEQELDRRELVKIFRRVVSEQ